MSVTGTLIAESLELGRDITVALTIRRLCRIAVAAAAEEQPPHWTLIDFTCADEDADALAAQVAEALMPGRWYADFGASEMKYVVFAESTDRSSVRVGRVSTALPGASRDRLPCVSATGPVRRIPGHR